MSHFYGTLKGNKGEATRAGSKNSGIITYAASWRGAIVTRVYHDEKTDEDVFTVSQTTWQGSGIQEALAQGVIGKPAKQNSEIVKRAIEGRTVERAVSVS
jgi:hypothetical protein